MFKKIEIWILYLIIILFFPALIFVASLVRQELVGTQKLGKISRAALFLGEIPVNFKKILSGKIDYSEVPDRFPDLNGFNGNPNVQESYIILSKYDGSLRKGVLELIDLTNFEVLHIWNPDFDKFNKLIKKDDEFKTLNVDRSNSVTVPRHPLLLKDGGLIFQEETPLRKIDACSNLLWQNSKDQFHHSSEKDIDGNFWVPSYIYPPSLPIEKVGIKTIGDNGYHDDGIVKLSPNGEILYEKSVSQIFIENGLEYLLFSVGEGFKDGWDSGNDVFIRDPIHLNDIQPVNFDGEFWKKGDVFLSLRHQSMILLYRPSNNKIIWKSTGPFFHQHDVDILDKNRVSVFNNNSKKFFNGDIVDGHNEILIYDFNSKQYSKYLAESLIINDVRTKTEGTHQILPNGDLFIDESNYGRILYFNANGSLRWTHLNRSSNGKTYRTNWSRILFSPEDILNVKNFLKSRSDCEF